MESIHISFQIRSSITCFSSWNNDQNAKRSHNYPSGVLPQSCSWNLSSFIFKSGPMAEKKEKSTGYGSYYRAKQNFPEIEVNIWQFMILMIFRGDDHLGMWLCLSCCFFNEASCSFSLEKFCNHYENLVSFNAELKLTFCTKMHFESSPIKIHCGMKLGCIFY